MKNFSNMVLKSNVAAAPRKRGFTLIELMVATAIMTLLVLAVMGVTSHVLTTWSSASGRLGANAEARIALQYLGDDLETLVVRPKLQPWLQVTYDPSPVPGMGSVPNISLISATEHRDRSGGDYGNICAVNYQLDYRNPIVGGTSEPPSPQPVAGLYRKVVGPQATFNDILITPTGTVPVPLHPLVGINNTANFANFLSSNIADLSIDFYAEDLDATGTAPRVVFVGDVAADGTRTRVPFIYADKLYRTQPNGTAPTAMVTNQSSNYGRIVYADIRMTVLSDEGAKLLATAGVRELSDDQIRDLIKQHGTVFSRRVPILSRY